jgi:hypothetical protein
MKRLTLFYTILLVCRFFTVTAQNDSIMKLFFPDDPTIHYTGRIDFADLGSPVLISAGSYFTFQFSGTCCSVLMKYASDDDGYAYIAVECDNRYIGRIKVDSEQEKYQVVSNLADTIHTLRICKATEAITGNIVFKGIECINIMPVTQIPFHRIECIGNSITCGAESDKSEIPCNTGTWYDHHNAYLAYGPRLARSLNADWVLSSVSGMGLTRNWNNEGPALPAFYDNLYLNGDSTKVWSGKDYNPDLITICLGTNDNSDGDGSYDRQPLDSNDFINVYVKFVMHIHQRYPDASICLINSPVFDGELREKFESYLESTIEKVKLEQDFKNYFIFHLKRSMKPAVTDTPILTTTRICLKNYSLILKK